MGASNFIADGILGGDRRRECPITLDSETFDGPQVERLRKRANRLEPVGTAKGERRFGVAKKIFELGERIGSVQRQENRARSKTSERNNDHVRRFLDLDRDPIAGPERLNSSP